jgi:hypothetical protein
MERSEYLNAVNEFFYQGEVLGEAFFGRCLELETDPARRYIWATLQQLETETKAKLRPFLMRLGVSVVQHDLTERVTEFTNGFADKSWRLLMEEIAGVTRFYLEKFRQIEAAAQEGERGMARSMIAHETALHNFAKRELAGETQRSLDEVIAQLQWPLPAPA